MDVVSDVRGIRTEQIKDAVSSESEKKPMKKGKRIGIILFVIVWLLGAAGFFLYPSISEMVNNMSAKGVVNDYNEAASALTSDEYAEMRAKVSEYNKNTVGATVQDVFSEDREKKDTDETYEALAAIGRDGQLGNINIPCIGCALPVYHGSDESMLDEGALHMYRTSLPSDDDDIHVVISAHTAFPGKEFFNRLTDLEIGDTFNIDFLGDVYEYEVIDINVVLPYDSDLLQVESGKNLCTLVTCTPYSVNTHRLLVRGELKNIKRHTSEIKRNQVVDLQHSDITLFIIIGAVLLFIIIVVVIVIIKTRNRKEE